MCPFAEYLCSLDVMAKEMLHDEHEQALAVRDLYKVLKAFHDPNKTYELVDGLATEPQEWEVRCEILGVLCLFMVYVNEGTVSFCTYIPQPPIKDHVATYSVYRPI